MTKILLRRAKQEPMLAFFVIMTWEKLLEWFLGNSCLKQFWQNRNHCLSAVFSRSEGSCSMFPKKHHGTSCCWMIPWKHEYRWICLHVRIMQYLQTDMVVVFYCGCWIFKNRVETSTKTTMRWYCFSTGDSLSMSWLLVTRLSWLRNLMGRIGNGAVYDRCWQVYEQGE